MKVLRFFGPLFEKQEKWLNEMALNGYRLIKTGKAFYEFEECKPGEYSYAVEYVGNMDYENFTKYSDFLEEMGYMVYHKNINLNYSIGKIKFRLYKDKPWIPVTNSTTHNKELLIVEKKNDGKEFELHTTKDDVLAYYKEIVRLYATMCIFCAALAVVFKSIILGAVAVLFLIPTVVFAAEVNKIKSISAEDAKNGKEA